MHTYTTYTLFYTHASMRYTSPIMDKLVTGVYDSRERGAPMTQQMIYPQGTPAHNGSVHAHAAGASQVAPQGQHQGQPIGGPAASPQQPEPQQQPQQRTFAAVGGPPAGLPMVPSQQPPAKENFFSAHKRDILIGTGAAIFGAMFLGNTGKLITDVATSATNSRRNQQG